MIYLPIKGGEKLAIAPSKIIAVGLNYREHVKESRVFDLKKHEIPKEPVLFAKTPNVLIGPGDPIIIPSIVKEYAFPETRTDLEAELVIIIGRRCRNVSARAAKNYILGYSAFNDVSQRNIQKSDASGWFRGKSFDSFGPIGPVVVPESVLDPTKGLVISARINGRTVQSASTADMIFPITELVAFISRNFTLEEGDLIATGTPSGVSPIVHGDIVEVEIEGIGVLKNPVIEEERGDSI